MIIEKHIFTGGANNKNLLAPPPLTITTAAIDTFIVALQESLVELIIIMSQILPDKEMPF
jgi:acetylornithine aminotransferase